VKLVRTLLIAAIVWMAGASPVQASPITIMFGDADWFGTGLTPGGPGPFIGNPGPMQDYRSPAEMAATDGTQLTDVYSALYYYGVGSGCDVNTDPGCSPNGDIGTLIFPFSGFLNSATISMLMGDFECNPNGAMTVDINGVFIPFCFDDGFQGVELRSFVLSPEMIAAANLIGEIRMTFDHRAGFDQNNVWQGSFDYIAFDYFEVDADVTPVPEPGTLVLLGAGLGVLLRQLRKKSEVKS
jgi:hypothetical protein